jgi:hypothetical protein
MSHRCQRTQLAQCDYGRIEQCTCGTLHVSSGPVTVRVDKAALAALANMFAEAHGKVNRKAEQSLQDLQLLWGELPVEEEKSSEVELPTQLIH